MKSQMTWGGRLLGLFAAAAFFASGCGQTATTSSTSKEPAATKGGPQAGDSQDKSAHEHGEWWCDEHGLPEHVCDLCNKKYRNQEKANGNWCEHNRVKTSCFKCNPGLKDKFAAEYKLKYGKAPPATEDEEDDKKGVGKTDAKK